MSSPSPSPGKGKEKKKEQYTQLSLFQAFNGKIKHPAQRSSSTSSTGPHRNSSNGTTSRYFSKDHKEVTDISININSEPRDLVDSKDEIMEDALPESQESASREKTEKQPVIDPTSGRYHNEAYATVAKENIEISKIILPYIFTDPSQNPDGYLYDAKDIQHLGAAYCPGYTLLSPDPESGKKGCRIRVLDADSYDVACEMLERHKKELESGSNNTSFNSQGTNTSTTGEFEDNGPVVLNMANQKYRGGGWRKGCMAQEEELCYRSTLHASLPRKLYPMTDTEGIYSPFVAIIRSRCTTGHTLYPMASFIYETHTSSPNALITKTPPLTPLPIVSVITIAAIRDPQLKLSSDNPSILRYKETSDRYLMRSKIRMMFRMAALNGHRRLVLGALGCGAFNNPKEQVVELFRETLLEEEFRGGWWKEVTFAVLDTEKEGKMKGKDGMGNYGIFFRALNGLIV